MVGKHGGNFDDPFYCETTILPNTHLFIHLKEGIADAYELNRRSKTHTSSHLQDETQTLLAFFQQEQLHLFCSTCSMGFACNPLDNLGYDNLGQCLAEEQDKQTARARILKVAQVAKLNHSNEKIDNEIEAIQLSTRKDSGSTIINPIHSSTASIQSPTPLLDSQSVPPPALPNANDSSNDNNSDDEDTSSKAGDSETGESRAENEETEVETDMSDQQLHSGLDFVPTMDEQMETLINKWFGDGGEELLNYEEDQSEEDNEDEQDLSDNENHWSDGD
ncbi:hypothetical protein PM082_012328 [Marasmius tenuissimus]|nr:hypothetical protein PM082_012328 [Marasmius tenuissimus]